MIEALPMLNGWANRLDMGEVPHEVGAATVDQIATAIARCQQDPPDVQAATAAIEEAFSLWV